ncbi:hypothetical protein BT96DRAFT_1009484 [Gymnopus androsaceus JB14]|uniref:Uncharacterized protein n=1 Tax=Gymnopus androsaceus JB14 TaxID=1447944 RepID=A0A6A4GCQ7_9AGAR|nr:hypothetical protein BT96DRAFT_1009484 [Gymnopus androsaceus JB14]
MEFDLAEVDALHDATTEGPTMELSLGAMSWFEDVENTYFSEDDWETEEGDELTDSELEEDSDSESMPALQAISDSDLDYGSNNDSIYSDDSSTTDFLDVQYPPHKQSSYPTHFDAAPFSLKLNEPGVETLPEPMPEVVGNFSPEIALKEATAKSADNVAHARFYDQRNEDMLFYYEKCLW